MRRTSFPLLFISVLLLACFFGVAVVPWAQSPAKPNLATAKPLVLYDNFNGPRIDPAKWNDWMASANMREAVRELSPPYQGQGNNGPREETGRESERDHSTNDGAAHRGLHGSRRHQDLEAAAEDILPAHTHPLTDSFPL